MKKVKCPKCKHEWETKSKLVLVTCPSCQLKVRIKKEKQIEGVQHDGGF